ncbi:MAG: sensor domain-containing diguanylate cyclase [Paucibacter sp.]|nr:sensor domain-containing diguanylate cyclase [Roseateles sp.]
MTQPVAHAPSNPMEALGLLDPQTAADLDVLTRMAALVTGAPRAFVTLADTDRVWHLPSATEAPRAGRREETYCSAALAAEDDVLVAADVRHDERTRAIAARLSGSSQTVAYAGALLRDDKGSKLGTLCVTDTVPHPLTDDQVQLLRGLARQVMHVISLRKTQKELTEALEKMTRLATTDELTGLLNRRAFFEHARQLGKLVQRQSGAMSLVVVDIDHFKRVNDTHGHAAGDAVLAEVARRLGGALRESDVIGRIGGEEFAIALPFTALDRALALMEKLRQAVRRQPVTFDNEAIGISVSVGVAQIDAEATDISATLRRADEALYQAKAAGRDLVMAA